MSARPKLDLLRFARSGESLSGELPLSALDRLTDLLMSGDGAVRYRLSGGVEAGRPAIYLWLEAGVVLRCQHCLGPWPHELRVERVFPVARDEAQLDLWERDDPLLDALVADPQLDVQTFIEDEILLSLPVAPRHPEGECGRVG